MKTSYSDTTRANLTFAEKYHSYFLNGLNDKQYIIKYLFVYIQYLLTCQIHNVPHLYLTNSGKNIRRDLQSKLSLLMRKAIFDRNNKIIIKDKHV